MAARAMWKAELRLDDLRLPVKLYAAVEDRTVHFRLLHDRDHVPLRQALVIPATGEEVPREEARKGLPMGDGTFVILDDEELEGLDPEPSREITVDRFLPSRVIDHRWYDRPYYLGPDGEESAYAALAAALEGGEREGLARWVMRSRSYRGALRAEGPWLVLVTLRAPDEVVALSGIERPREDELDARELEMAGTLISHLEGEFDPAEHPNEHRLRTMGLIHAKAEGKTVPIEPYRERREEREGSLAEMLERSLESA